MILGRPIRSLVLAASLALGAAPSCQLSSQPVSTRPSQQVLDPNQPIYLTRDEINVIMWTRVNRGDSCTLSQLTTNLQIQTFWHDAARYILETKYATEGRNEYPEIAAAYGRLAPNQRTEAINRLATLLNALGSPYNLLDFNAYNGACSQGVYIPSSPYPYLTLGSETNAQLLALITRVSADVSAEGQTPSQPGPAVCDEAAARALLTRDATVRTAMLRDFGGGFSIFDLDDATGTSRPYQVRAADRTLTQVGAADRTLTLRGDAFNFGNQLPTGLEVTFSGPGVTRTSQPITLNGDGSLSVPITITSGTHGLFDVTVTIPRAGQAPLVRTLTDGLEVIADRPAGVRRPSAPDRAEETQSTPRGYCDENPTDSMCRF